MKNHEIVASIRESERLEELEKTIARGKKTFVEVGLALAEIRDLRLYKREYGSFSEYCQKKWGWEKRYTQYVIAGAAAVKSLPEETRTLVHHETAARELAKVEPDQRAAVVQTIVDEEKSVTAKEIKRHLPPPPMVRSKVNMAEGTPDKPAGEDARAKLPPPPSQILDGTGWPIPTQLIPLWQRTGEVQEMLTVLSRIKGTLRYAQEHRDKLFAEVNFSSALSQLDQAWYDLKTAKPFAVCPTCQGQLPDQCTLCRGRGLISEHRWNTCVTREDKEFRQRAKQKAESRK
jgi:hypothetical protein